MNIYHFGIKSCNTHMDVYKIRLLNLRALARQEGGITALADRLDKSQSRISQLIGINPIKNIGSRTAREVERKFKKSEGWMDQLHPDLYVDLMQTDEQGIKDQQAEYLSPDERALLDKYRQTDQRGKRQIQSTANSQPEAVNADRARNDQPSAMNG